MSLGLLVIAFSPDLKSAGLMLVFIVTLFNWFNGVVVPYDQIQVFWRYWVRHICTPNALNNNNLGLTHFAAVLHQPFDIPIWRYDHRCQRKRQGTMR